MFIVPHRSRAFAGSCSHVVVTVSPNGSLTTALLAKPLHDWRVQVGAEHRARRSAVDAGSTIHRWKTLLDQSELSMSGPNGLRDTLGTVPPSRLPDARARTAQPSGYAMRMQLSGVTRQTSTGTVNPGIEPQTAVMNLSSI